MEKITEQDLIEAILAASATGPDAAGLTAAELVDRSGMSEKWVRKRLRALKTAGRLAVGRAGRETIDGRVVRVPVYSLA